MVRGVHGPGASREAAAVVSSVVMQKREARPERFFALRAHPLGIGRRAINLVPEKLQSS
jgi:hypothetical protein